MRSQQAIVSHRQRSGTPATDTDGRDFPGLTESLQRELHLHCYRMLGSLTDADDALQETLLRAWRGLDQFEPRAPLRAWLYRIATNVCLTMLAKRTQRSKVASLDRLHDRDRARREGEPMHLQPYPDPFLDGLATGTADPAIVAEQREGVALAFVTAIQLLPPRQRAALLLRDVVGYSAAEVARMLETSVAGVNSALQRARATVARERDAGHLARPHAALGTAAEAALVQRLVQAWQTADITSLVAILTEDALFTMPPLPQRFVGREAIRDFLVNGPLGGRLDHFRLLPTRANGQPALGAYWRDGDVGAYRAHGFLVLSLADGGIASVSRFADPMLFARFGLPPTIDD